MDAVTAGLHLSSAYAGCGGPAAAAPHTGPPTDGTKEAVHPAARRNGARAPPTGNAGCPPPPRLTPLQPSGSPSTPRVSPCTHRGGWATSAMPPAHPPRRPSLVNACIVVRWKLPQRLLPRPRDRRRSIQCVHFQTRPLDSRRRPWRITHRPERRARLRLGAAGAPPPPLALHAPNAHPPTPPHTMSSLCRDPLPRRVARPLPTEPRDPPPSARP